MTKYFPIETMAEGIKLQPYFYQYFDISTEFKKFCPQAVNCKTMREMLAYLTLKEIASETTC